MNVLLTNDDGISAEGINVLYEVFSKYHNVYMIAPDSEQSACSNAFSIRSEVAIKRVSEKKFSLSGFPADCVVVGLNSNIIPRVDIVISGINHGPNLGVDQFFSGTVGGARTAFISGKTGVAISIDSYHEVSEFLSEAANFLLKFVEEMENKINGEQLFFNINYPNVPKEKIKGVKYTYSGKRTYNDKYEVIKDNGEEIILLQSGKIGGLPLEGSDFEVLQNNYISITPLTIDCTDFAYLKNINTVDN
ncbi:5'/3'-nucleotidase SurE [Spirochaetota bacterium]